MIKGLHALLYTPKPEELRAFIRDKLGFPFTDTGEGWLIFDMPEAIWDAIRRIECFIQFPSIAITSRKRLRK